MWSSIPTAPDHPTRRNGLATLRTAGTQFLGVVWLATAVVGANADSRDPGDLSGRVGTGPVGEATLARPSPQQYAWHERERIQFVCLDPCTWQGREYDNHSTPLDRINPMGLDTDQWCRAAKSWGAQEMLFVAKHTGGFCWWQTDTSKYGVKETAWKGGRGDVLAELSASCRRHGLALGVYVFPGDDTWGAPIGSGGRTKDPARQQAYNQVFRRQLTEVLTRYGTVAEVWFDGSCVIDVSDILRLHASEAVIFQGPQATIRWPGTESGRLPYPAWNSLRAADLRTGVATAVHGDPDGDAWAPLEADTTLYDHNWFWSAENEKKRKSLEDLMDIYYKSAGRGGVLLLNSTPNTNGLIPELDMRLYEAFGREIERRFGRPMAETAAARGAEVELAMGQPTRINHALIMEDYRDGERIREYVVEGLGADGWRESSRGTAVGRKKIDRFPPVEVSRVRLRVTRAAAEPRVRRLAVFDVPGVSAGSLTTGRATTASTVHSPPYVAAMATDDDRGTRWGCPDGTTACWLDVDLGAPTRFGQAAIAELADRIQRFTLAYRDTTNGPWRTAFAGTRVGPAFRQEFPEVTARFVRLDITEASGPPTIWEFDLYPGGPGWQRCATWTAQEMARGAGMLSIDLSPYIPRPGQYEVKLEPAEGSAPVRIEKATLFFEGEEATPGMLTRSDSPLSFNVNRTAQVTRDTTSALKVAVTFGGGTGAGGTVWIRPQSRGQ
jgi:alpha-L-fucosidase